MTIRAISVTLVAPMENHIANGGEKLLGNASSIKRRPDGRVYISGQMQRHALFSAVERLNLSDGDRKGTYVSNGDGVTNILENDLRADMGGFLLTNKGDYSGRRTAPLTATPAVALAPSDIGRDLTLRIKENPHKYADSKTFSALTEEQKKTRSRMEQALATREFSQCDNMVMSFFLDLSELSIRKTHSYETDFHVATHYCKFCSPSERRRRAKMALEATGSMTDYANQARNATTGEPQKVLIVFDTKLSRKASRYFTTENDSERKNILNELKARGATYFLGDDTIETEDEKNHLFTVAKAYQVALAFLADEQHKICDPAPEDTKIWTTPEFDNQGRDVAVTAPEPGPAS